MSTEAFDSIVKWAKLINEKPNYSSTYFFLSDNAKAMIIDLSRMKEMPNALKRLKEKEKAYLFIDLTDEKSVRYYAHDIQSNVGASPVYINETEGELLFSVVENDVLSFIEENISDLTNHKMPLTRLVEMNEKDYNKVWGSRPTQNPQSSNYNRDDSHIKTNVQNPYGVPTGGTPYQHSAWPAFESKSFPLSSYKEREQFIEAIYSAVKYGKTANAVDHIYEFISNKKEDKEMLNSIFRFISLDKLDIISLKELLKATSPIKEELSERESIFKKFKDIVTKTRPKMAESLISEIEANARNIS